MIDFSDAYEAISASKAADWVTSLPAQIGAGFNSARYGDLPDWIECLENLPQVTATHLDLAGSVTVGAEADCDEQVREAIRSNLHGLLPWRKGPFRIHGIDIDTEWRSDWKWDRLLPHISPLKGKTVLDVGCGNGYHCWRMRGEGAALVLGIDPSPRFIVQFHAIKHFIGDAPVHLLPVGIEAVPENLQAFDTVFSMGVLYHRKSPLDHLQQLKDCLVPGGELVLETLVVEGDDQQCLVPEGRYAKMRNVWFIPSVELLSRWLRRCGFRNVRAVDVNQTSLDEQRATEWMQYESLKDFLDSEDINKTIEGLPAPRRVILVAEKAR